MLTILFFPPAQLLFRTVALTPSQLLTATAYLMAAPILSAILSLFFRKKQA